MLLERNVKNHTLPHNPSPFGCQQIQAKVLHTAHDCDPAYFMGIASIQGNCNNIIIY